MKQLLLHHYYKFLARLARRYISKRQPFVIGINGSVGKTSARMILTEILQLHLWDELHIYTSPKNFNGELWLPLSIFKIENRNPSITWMLSAIKTMRQLLKSNNKPYDILILEYGTDHPGEMDFLLNIVKPQLSVVTKFDAVHSLQYGSEQAIAQEELKLQQVTTLYNYINTDDQYALNLSKHLNTKIIYYQTNAHEAMVTPLPGRRGDGGEVSISNYTIKKSNKSVQASSTLNFANQELDITTNLLWQINHNYIALSYDILDKVRQQFNISHLTLKTDLTLQLQPGRFSIFEGIYDSILIDSTYNASPSSMRAVISESIQLQKKLFPDSHRVFILGEMRELWDLEQSEHKALADRLLDEVLQPEDTVILLWQAMNYTYQVLSSSWATWTTKEWTKSKALTKNIRQSGTWNSNLKSWSLRPRLYHYTSFQDVSSKAQELLTQRSNHNQQAFVILKWSQNTIFLEEVVKALLKNPDDAHYLTRQSASRASKKKIQ